MKKFPLTINLKRDIKKEQEDIDIAIKAGSLPAGEVPLSDKELILDYVNHAFRNVYPEGAQGQKRRIIGRIQRKFDKAVEDDSDFVELEDSEFETIDKAFEEAKFPTGISKYINEVEATIEDIKSEDKEKKDGKKEEKPA